MKLYLFLITLISTFASLEGMHLQPQDVACECKNWKQSYKSGDVLCGASNEFFFVHDTSAPTDRQLNDVKKRQLVGNFSKQKTYNDMVCTEFLEVLDNNKCLNVNLGNDEGTWCYVDSNCKKLNLGSKVRNSMVAWKRCKGEPNFRTYSPEDLFDYAEKQDLWFAYLEKMAYTGQRAPEGYLVDVAEFNNTYPSRLGMTLTKLLQSGIAYYFDTHSNGTVPHIIIHGNKSFIVEENPAKDEKHPGTWNRLTCIHGCEDKSN